MTNKNIEIIAEQDDFIIVCKPSGIGFHDEESQTGFYNQVKAFLSYNVLYPVHRLDKMTSGLLILAKNKKAAHQFQMLFESKNVEKYYLAISDCKPTKKQGLIKGDMEKSRRGMWKLLRGQTNPAISQFFSFSLGKGKRLYLVKPHTGKTHQIRVALNSIGAPIIGDPTYYSQSKFDRGYLHAFSLRFRLNNQDHEFTHCPTEGKEYVNEACRLAMSKLSNPWTLSWPVLK